MWGAVLRPCMRSILEGQGSRCLTSTTQMKKMPRKRRGERGSSEVFGDLDTKEYRFRQKQHQLKASFAIYIRPVHKSLSKPLSILTREIAVSFTFPKSFFVKSMQASCVWQASVKGNRSYRHVLVVRLNEHCSCFAEIGLLAFIRLSG